MIAAITLGWVLAVLVIDVVLVRPWKTVAARAPLPWVLAIAAGAWALALGARSLSETMGRGMWTAASVTMGLVPLKATLYSLVAYAAGRTFLSARASHERNRWLLPALLAGAVIYLVAEDIRTVLDHARESHAESAALSPPEVATLAERIRSRAASDSEKHAFLANPLCPPELLAAFATSPEVSLRTDVARNPKLPAVIAETLSRDQNELVRYYLAFNRDLPAEVLARLQNDPDENVRAAANR